jgi:signal transduction histidine kinase
MSTFRFKPSARLQRYLGRELISDPNLAVLEFVKNAYDADARNVFVTFSFPREGAPFLVIADDGGGMDETGFERDWMHPGFSRKSPDAARLRGGRKVGTRIPVGEKGLGRLAAGRLGESLDVFTRTTTRRPWLHVFFDWSKFDDMTKLIDEIQIPFDYQTPPPDSPVASGTILVIHGIEANWAGRVRGRPVKGRSRTRLGRLKQDFELLLRPLPPSDLGFAIHLDSDSVIEPSDIGTVIPGEVVETADYVYSFEYRVKSAGRATIHRELRRSDSLIGEFGGEGRRKFPVVEVAEVARAEGRPDDLRCGPFRGRFLYTPPPAARRAKEVEAVGSGVLLYRDSVLVEPYGLDGNDWVGVSARKAQRQGYALIQPSLFSGYVLISREANPELRDMSNRLGLLENEPTEIFLRHVQAEFSFFEAEVFDELKQRWESMEEKAARQAEQTIDLAAIRLRAIAHSLGQPLTGLAADVRAIRIIAKKPGIPRELSDQLVNLADSAAAHVRQAQESLGRFREVPANERTLVPVQDLVNEAVSPVRPLARSLGIKLKVAAMPARSVLVHRELLIEAVSEIVRNGLESDRPCDAVGLVELDHHEEDGDFVLEVIDDGSGIPNVGVDGDLSTIASTKGRPGMGLATVLEIVLASRGRIRVAETGPDGTRIEIRLPDRIKGLRI